MKFQFIRKTSDVFLKEHFSQKLIDCTSETIVALLFGSKLTNTGLTHCCSESFTRQPRNTIFSLSQLPPTADEAEQYGYRSNLQMQCLRDTDINPLQ